MTRAPEMLILFGSGKWGHCGGAKPVYHWAHPASRIRTLAFTRCRRPGQRNRSGARLADYDAGSRLAL